MQEWAYNTLNSIKAPLYLDYSDKFYYLPQSDMDSFLDLMSSTSDMDKKLNSFDLINLDVIDEMIVNGRIQLSQADRFVWCNLYAEHVGSDRKLTNPDQITTFINLFITIYDSENTAIQYDNTIYFSSENYHYVFNEALNEALYVNGERRNVDLGGYL